MKKNLIRQAGYRNLELAEEKVAEFDYRPVACQRSYRVVVVRKRIRVEQGQRRLFDEVRYLFYITNVSRKEKKPSQLVGSAHQRCNQENVVEQLKNGVEAMRMPSDTLVSNWAYLAIAAQAWNLKAWLGLLHPKKSFGREVLRMQFQRFLRRIMQLPCQILRHSRRLTYRLISVNEWTEQILLGSLWLRRRRFG